MVSKQKTASILCLTLLVLNFLYGVVVADSMGSSCSNSVTAEPSQDKSQCIPKKKSVLFINAANKQVDWSSVNAIAYGGGWEVQELMLANFGQIMRDYSFTAALDYSYQTMKHALDTIQPDVLLVKSKGVGVIAYLASKGLWVNKPVILFSPIPNPIDSLVNCDLEEMGWKDTIEVYRQSNLGPVLVASGSSSDEELLITNALQDPSACGELVEESRTFELCRNWRHIVVPGDHGWSGLQENEALVSTLIDFMVIWLSKYEG